MIAPRIDAEPCTAAEADAAIAALQHREGMSFGVDAGVPGIHPLQAAVCVRPALRLRLWQDGLEAQGITASGRALLASPAMSAWLASTGRGKGREPLDLARAFLGCFEPSPDTLLLGALPFQAYRLGTTLVSKRGLYDGLPFDSDAPIGTLWFPECFLRRDADGRWSSVTLALPGAGSPAPADHGPAPQAPEPPTGDDHGPGAYAGMVERAVAVLKSRPLVSLTLSQSYRREVDMTAAEGFTRLRGFNPAPASFFVNDGSGLRLFGASPDLQLVVRGREVASIPVCGTVARRPGPAGEAESIRELLANAVDAAALAVCSQAMREDLEPLCEPGSLRVTDRQRPMALATVVHALDRVEGRLRADADAWDCIAATGAPVMVTGTPRLLALQAIAELEASPRGWYGGLMVQVAANGDALAGTILRAAAVRGRVAEVRTGGDLLADSDPAHEEEESRLKTRSLWRAFGLDAQGHRP